MRTLPPLLPLLSLIAIGACATLPQEPRSDGMARLGETTRVGALTVRPLAVVEDSRCPENARCIVAGRLIVQARVGRDMRNLELRKPDAAGVVLDSADPAKRTDRRILPGAWRFHFSAVRP
ncbi:MULTISPECIES: hypothetical protein [unclassified Sphingomonas]|uniref:hypothetical protein n=1 Tax=Novosphingobium rhizosphaerae TaxID=1551649 RepID=UPI0015CEC7FF